MLDDFQVSGQNAAAPFTLKAHRGDGMLLLGMNWKNGQPPDNFVGFAIEYKEPGGDRYYALKNRIAFSKTGKDANRLSTLRSPIQKFRWVHFPRNANLAGKFTYRVTPVFMNNKDELSYGEPQQVQIALCRETYPGQLNVAYTRGFVSSQSFVDKYGTTATLLPKKAEEGLKYVPTHPKADDALTWMGFEARECILDVLDKAIADATAQVRVVAYDLNEPGVISRLEQLGARLKIIIDDEGAHGKKSSAESQAAEALRQSAGKKNVKRQHMGKLQHNKTIIVDGSDAQFVVCGSTNFSWRAFFVQDNNAVVLQGKGAIEPFLKAFNHYWENDAASAFGDSGCAQWTDLSLANIDAKVAFSPHSKANALLASIASDIEQRTTSSLFYSLAFLSITPGAIKKAITKVTKNNAYYVYGISDKKVGGIDLQMADGNRAPVYAAALTKGMPEPFKSEPTGGSGTRMHHKFIVIDFDKPTARVYLGSYNFSIPADTANGENLLLIRDRRVAVSYAVEAMRIYDHFRFRVVQQEAKEKRKRITLAKPPRKAGQTAWFVKDYTEPWRIRDRELFA